VARDGIPPAIWLWSSPEAAQALASRDLGTILRAYRQLNRLSQEKLAAILGYDKTYVSMIETGRRTIGDVAVRRHIAEALALPTHTLGVTDTSDADFAALTQFADSTIRLAEVVRQAGRAVEAVNELWPLVARLEARAAEGHLERETLMLLGRARLALGVSLGTVLPEERLITVARWTGKALVVAEHLGDVAFIPHALRMHGNELRKVGRLRAAIARLQRSIHLSVGAEDRGTGQALLARAAGEQRHALLFDQAIAAYQAELEANDRRSVLFNHFTLREIQLRGLLNTDRAAEAMRIIRGGQPEATPVAPQWSIIERVTAGEVLIASGQRDEAEEAFSAAIRAAELNRLPHQIQRATRAAHANHLHDVLHDGHSALARLSQELSSPID
jgi:transcriptional regulator with XRE-family HTH domain